MPQGFRIVAIGLCTFTAVSCATGDRAVEAVDHSDEIVLRPTQERTVCQTCVISLQPIFVYHTTPTQTGGAHIFSQLQRGGDGRYYLAPTVEPGEVEVLDSTGSRILRFGRQGDGPKELRAIAAAVATDSGIIVVVDRGRHNPLRYYDAAGGYQGAGGQPISVRRLQWTKLGLLASTWSFRRDSVFPAYLLEHEQMAPIGAFPAEDAARMTHWQDAEATSLNGQIWIARADRFDLAAFSPSGERTRHHTRDELRFERGDRVIGITAVDGYIVLVTHVRDPEYRDPDDWDPTRPLSTELIDRKLDTRVDFIDPETGTYIASGQLDYGIAGVSGPGELYMPREEPDGTMSIHAWRVRLTTAEL